MEDSKTVSKPFIYTFENFWFLDTEELLSSGYSRYRLKSGLFSLSKPYIFSKQTLEDTQTLSISQIEQMSSVGASKEVVEEELNEEQRPPKRRKRQKKPKDKLYTNKLFEENEEIRVLMTQAQSVVKALLKESKPVQQAAEGEEIDLLCWADLALTVQRFSRDSNDPVSLDISEFDPEESSSAFNHLVTNKESDERVLSLFGKDFIIPKNCAFLMSDFQNLLPLRQESKALGGYNLIVIDPPWENKSVARAKKYSTLPNYEIMKIPMKTFTSDNGSMIIVWVTNKLKYHQFIKEKLFPFWNVTYQSTWFWLKLTDAGDTITPLESAHRKPYEPFIIGTVGPFSTDQKILEFLANPKVVCSIPGKHSRKPPLEELFRSVLPSNHRNLELFARNLLPNWTSWGNEVLHFQYMNNFMPREVSSK